MAKGADRGLDALWTFDDPAGSERRFREHLRTARRSADLDHRSETITQLARSQALQRKFRAAHRTLDELAPLLPRLSPRVRIRYFLERGRTLNSAGSRRKALPLFVRAWSLARRHREDGLAVDAAHMVALVRSGTSQERWNARALALAQRSREAGARRWRGSLLNNMGWSRADAGDYRTALRLFRAALRQRERQRVADEVRIAKWCVAKTLRLLGRTRDALRMQRALLWAWRRAHKVDGYVLEELAECLFALGENTEARRYFRLAHANLSKDPWLTASEPARLARLAQLGRPGRTNRPDR